MTGLNLESFLRILRADLGAWASLGVAAAILAVMTWTSWGSKRALRKCLFLSIAAHVGLLVYGSSSPEFLRALRLDPVAKPSKTPERSVRITPLVAEKTAPGPGGRPIRKVADWDLDRNTLAMAGPARLASPVAPPSRSTLEREGPAPLATPSASPEVQAPLTLVPPSPVAIEARTPEPPPKVAEGDPSEVAAPVAVVPPILSPIPAERLDVPAPSTARARPPLGGLGPTRAAPERARPAASDLPEPSRVNVVDAPRLPPPAPAPEPRPIADREGPPTASLADLDPGPTVNPPSIPVPSPVDASPDPGIRRAPRPGRESVALASPTAPPRLADRSSPSGLAGVTPAATPSVPGPPRTIPRRSLSDVPSVYRSRLDPNRTTLAQRAGASVASEQAVERALDWLGRHQDADGRWDGGTARFKDGSVPPDDDSFTIHCPAGEVCFGECYYGEADNALTGLSLLAYLGSGYTHLDGKHAQAVSRGLDFLIRSQKPDGDLRGTSLVVGMYCHAMATLALCEAYALTRDERLRPSVEKALGFLVRARAVDGLAWRYAPGAPSGDTSILGWAVMALKSGRTVGVPIPANTQAGVVNWLKRVSKGRDGGLAFYNFDSTGTNVTPTMTAEAWACRQFLEVGGPGPASDEAADYLLKNPADRGEYNIYYLYYGTLAMYQHGGPAWASWNARVRDNVVRRQRTTGHMAGSWDPDDSPYGTKGGRIYGTALATLTLEVYYRFLRLYEPSGPSPVAPAPADGGARRAGIGSPGNAPRP